MKIRQGFISNSSSSSFILQAKKHPNLDADVVYAQLEEMYIGMFWDGEKKSLKDVKKRFRDCLYVVNVTPQRDKKELAKWMNSFTFWGFEAHDMKNGVWIISNGDNAIPYEFIEKIQNTFDCEYHYLG